MINLLKKVLLGISLISTIIAADDQILQPPWVGVPYMSHPLGEGMGSSGDWDKQVRYRTDGFDCQTYVETVLAWQSVDNQCDWHCQLDKIRYGGQSANYKHRLHFTSWQWNPAMIRQHYVEAIMDAVDTQAHVHSHVIATTLTPRAWAIRQLTALTHVQALSLEESQDIQRYAQYWPEQASTMVSVWYQSDVMEDTQLQSAWVAALPDVSVVEWVTPNPQYFKALVDTPLDVVHMGFLLKHDGHLVLLHASSLQKEIVSEDFMAYWQLHAKWGVNILKVVNPQITIYMAPTAE